MKIFVRGNDGALRTEDLAFWDSDYERWNDSVICEIFDNQTQCYGWDAEKDGFDVDEDGIETPVLSEKGYQWWVDTIKAEADIGKSQETIKEYADIYDLPDELKKKIDRLNKERLDIGGDFELSCFFAKEYAKLQQEIKTWVENNA